MDFGLVSLDNLGCSKNGSFDSENGVEIKKHKLCGSRFFKQDKAVKEEDFRQSKLAKTSPFGDEMLKIPLQMSDNCNFIEGYQMLSFSPPNSQNVAFPYFQHTSRSTGMTGASMHGALSGVRSPFTPSQWMELEHQALIYKYITANVPIPSYLLNPIRKALESAGFTTFSGLRSTVLGWGAFHLGFPDTDPEPSRCRRTDGKKWRCSKDVVTDKKYCERHMNRGRHRSRKPVEDQSGHSASGITNTNVKPIPITSSASASVVPAGGVSSSLSLSHRQLNNQQVDESNANRGLPNTNNVGGVYQHMAILPMALPGKVLQENQCDSGVNNDKEHSLRQFMDERPKNKPAEQRQAVPWLESDPQQERTQLSISIPVINAPFMPKPPLASSREHQAIQMGFGVGLMPGEKSQIETNWNPISWEPSSGGPLGEVLHNTNNILVECKNDKALNLMEGWDNRSQLASSPTGVLQRGTFSSVSKSSGRSSPGAETIRTLNGVSPRDGLVIPGAHILN